MGLVQYNGRQLSTTSACRRKTQRQPSAANPAIAAGRLSGEAPACSYDQMTAARTASSAAGSCPVHPITGRQRLHLAISQRLQRAEGCSNESRLLCRGQLCGDRANTAGSASVEGLRPTANQSPAEPSDRCVSLRTSRRRWLPMHHVVWAEVGPASKPFESATPVVND